MYSIHISPVSWLCSVLLFQTHWSAWMMCSIPDAIYAITSDTDMLNAPYSLFARYSLCTIMGSAMQRSTIICSMVSGRCRHATVCVSNQLLPAQLQYTFYLQVCFTFCEHYQIHLLQTKLPDFFALQQPLPYMTII